MTPVRNDAIMPADGAWGGNVACEPARADG